MLRMENLSFVIQGPFFNNNEFTTESCASTIRRLFPKSNIIFSTWAEPECKKFWDLLILNKDPGPGGKYYLDQRDALDNVNRQIVSSANGLAQAQTEYSIKIRSDVYFKSSALLHLLEDGKTEPSEYTFSSNYLITASNLSCNPLTKNTMLFHPCDWFVAGKTSDLIHYFDIPLAPKEYFNYHRIDHLPPIFQHPIASRYASEQYILTSVIKKSNIKVRICADAYDLNNESLLDSLRIFKYNFKLLPSWKLGFNSYKYRIMRHTSISNHFSEGEYKHVTKDPLTSLHHMYYNRHTLHRICDTALNALVRYPKAKFSK